MPQKPEPVAAAMGHMGLKSLTFFFLLLSVLHVSDMDPEKTTMQEVYDKFGLDANTASFTGHALALHLNDE